MTTISICLIASIPVMFYRYWLSVGAKPTEPVEYLLFRAGLGRQGGPFEKFSFAALSQEQPTNVDDSKDNGELDSPP